MVVTDAALGNVDESGTAHADSNKKVFSQSCLLVAYADKDCLAGKPGVFNPLDSRSHRIPRVSRSSYSAETLGFEEGIDSGQLLRAMVAELRGYPVVGKELLNSMGHVPMLGVVDAKDCHDKLTSDAGSWGTQKSLAYTVAALRQVFRRPNVGVRWTATQNMFVDGGTKDMDTDHFRKILSGGFWSVEYCTDFIKSAKSAAIKPGVILADNELPGTAVELSTASKLSAFSTTAGWSKDGDSVVQIARNAKSYRHPEPRHPQKDFPFRSSYGLYSQTGTSVWRCLEHSVEYAGFSNPRAQFSPGACVLVSIFSPLKQ